MHLSLAEKVAQMVVVRASGHLFDRQIRYPAWEAPADKLKYWISDLGIGGVIFVGGSAVEMTTRSQQLQSWAKIPLLLAADIEEGVGQRFEGATWFPPPMAIANIFQNTFPSNPTHAESYAEKMGAIIAREALAIGLNWILAPVVDVNNNPDNPVINIRAFGESPATVSKLASAFIRGAKPYPVLTCAKHFPGHGDTAVDSHHHLPVLPHSESRLAQIELPPFVEAIATGVDSVMSAHLSIPAWDKERPATLSPKILTGKLRVELGFEGLIVTDALVMGAIAKNYGSEEAAVLALEAGADILLMPPDAEAVIRAVCDAVTQGRISESRIDSSLEKIWQAKAKVFDIPEESFASSGEKAEWELNKDGQEKNPDDRIYSLYEKLELPEARAVAVEILHESLRFGGELPLSPQLGKEGKLRNLVLVDNLLGCQFLDRNWPAIALPAEFGYQLQLIDSHSPGINSSDLASGDFSGTLLQLFIRGNPFHQIASLTRTAKEFLKTLLRNSELHALVIYGSPYTLELFLPELSPNLPYVFSYAQMPEAQTLALQVLFGSFPKGG